MKRKYLTFANSGFFFLLPSEWRNLIIEWLQNSMHLYFTTFRGPSCSSHRKQESYGGPVSGAEAPTPHERWGAPPLLMWGVLGTIRFSRSYLSFSWSRRDLRHLKSKASEKQNQSKLQRCVLLLSQELMTGHLASG